MTRKIVRIVSRQGVLIPKWLLEQAHLKGTVEIVSVRDALVIRPGKSPRSTWDAAFRDMARRGDDALVD